MFLSMDVHVLLMLMTVLLSAVVAAPTATTPQCSSLSRGFHRAAPRLQDDFKSDKPPPSSSSTTFHEHYQAHSAEQDNTATASHEGAAAEQASRPNTRSVRCYTHTDTAQT